MKEIITEQLQEFKDLYLTELNKTLNNEYQYNKEVTENDFLRDLGVTPKITNRGTEIFEHTNTTNKKWKEAYNCRFITLDDFKEKKIEKKIKEFDKSLEKAIEKVIKKNLNIENLKLTPMGIGSNGNFEMFIQDGKKTVSLYTIVAEGEIQTAHYRFLVK